jgi:hypothetical protein
MNAPPIRSLVDIVTEHLAARKQSEFLDRVLGWVHNSLANIPESKARYKFRNRGKMARKLEVRRLKTMARSLRQKNAQLTEEERAWIQPFLQEVFLYPTAVAYECCADRLVQELASRLQKIINLKLACGWQPYLYGFLLPRIAYKHLGRAPSFSKDIYGTPRGLLLDFIRACLKHLGEADVNPQTIAKEIKKCRVRGEPSASPNAPYRLKHNWSFNDPAEMAVRISAAQK